MVSSTDWDPNEPITVENKEILINLLLYEEKIVRRVKKVEAIGEGLKVMGLAPFFCIDATRQLFLWAPVALNVQTFVKLINCYLQGSSSLLCVICRILFRIVQFTRYKLAVVQLAR